MSWFGSDSDQKANYDTVSPPLPTQPRSMRSTRVLTIVTYSYSTTPTRTVSIIRLTCPTTLLRVPLPTKLPSSMKRMCRRTANLTHTLKPRKSRTFCFPPLLFVSCCMHQTLIIIPHRAGAITAFLTQEVQTKGLDWWDSHKKEQLQRKAQAQAEEQIAADYS